MSLNTRSELTPFPHEDRMFPSALRVFLYLLYLKSLRSAFGFTDLEFHLLAFLWNVPADGFGMHIVFLPVFAFDEPEFTFGIEEYDLSL